MHCCQSLCEYVVVVQNASVSENRADCVEPVYRTVKVIVLAVTVTLLQMSNSQPQLVVPTQFPYSHNDGWWSTDSGAPVSYGSAAYPSQWRDCC